MHQYMYLCQLEFWILFQPLCIVTWKHGCHCVAMCVLQSSHFCSQTLVRMCTFNSTSIYVHLTPHFILTPLCIITWKDVCLCIAQCEYFSKLTCGPTPWLECVHASGHVFMSICLPMSPSLHLHTYMERWVPLCVFHSSPVWLHTLVRMCICFSTCIHVHLTPNVNSD